MKKFLFLSLALILVPGAFIVLSLSAAASANPITAMQKPTKNANKIGLVGVKYALSDRAAGTSS